MKVELTDLPNSFLIDGASVRVKGIGHCTILHVSYSDKPKHPRPEPVRRLVNVLTCNQRRRSSMCNPVRYRAGFHPQSIKFVVCIHSWKIPGFAISQSTTYLAEAETNACPRNLCTVQILWQTQEEKDAAKAKQEKTKQEIQRLTDELTVLNQQASRYKHMREVRVGPPRPVGLSTPVSSSGGPSRYTLRAEGLLV